MSFSKENLTFRDMCMNKMEVTYNNDLYFEEILLKTLKCVAGITLTHPHV